MNDSAPCFRREASLNELLHDPLVGLMMSSDGVRSDDIRALFDKMARQDEARRHGRRPVALEGCFIP